MRSLFWLPLLLLLLSTPLLAAEPKPLDASALAGLKTAKAIFDVRVNDSEKLIFNLKLIDETYDGIKAAGVKPELVVAFRGPGIKLLLSAELDDEAQALLQTLTAKGVRFEACAVAMRVFKVDPSTLTPEVKLVANVFNSLIGLQNQGYALIVIN